MKLKKTLLVYGLMLLITSCSTTEKFSVYVPSGTKIYTPDNTNQPCGVAANSDKVDVIVPSDMYCGYVLVQPDNSDLRVPIGLDYKIKKHTGTKAALYTGATLSCMGLGATVGGGIAMIAAYANGDEDMESTFGMVTAAGLGLTGIGAAIGAPSQARLRQTSYDYNFGYEKKQEIAMPTLSSTLLNPNPPKSSQKDVIREKGLKTSRKKASSGKDIISESTTYSSNVNKNRSDLARKIDGKYIGTGNLLYENNVDESYSEISVIIERVDKTHVSVRIIESEEDYFDAPLIYEIEVDKADGYNLKLDKLPEAVIKITKDGKLMFQHKKVNIDNQIYTLEIDAEKE